MSKVRFGLLVLLAVLVAGLLAGWLALRAFLGDVPDPRSTAGRAATPSILITDRSGRPLYEVIDPQGSKYLPLALADIPLACQQATIATEDSHFYTHPGVDPIAIARAAWLNWQGRRTVSGGSTLTQQLARNLYFGQEERTERSLRRKLREAWLAWRLERKYSKNDLLALYMNTTFYGHFATGIEAAAHAYFGTGAKELDLAQCALLAGLPQYPAGYNPIENLEAAQARQSVVLDLMVKNGYIGADEADQARKERLAFAATPFPIEAPHFVMWVQSQLETLLPSERLRSGGLRVTTTLDLDWQHQAEATVTRRLAQLHPCAAGVTQTCDREASPERRVDDAALVALDPGSGAVLAMVGSADYFDPTISGAVNAALSLRQPGSAIKPLTYAAAFDPERAGRAGQEPWTAATLIADVRTVFPTEEGRPYIPVNYDMRYHGPVTARVALANSYNIPAVKALQHIGLPALIDQAQRLGIGWALGDAGLPISAGSNVPAGPDSPQKQSTAKFGLSLTLGGGEVRLLDLTSAYAAFANGGKRVTPYAISRVETLDGDTLLDVEKGIWPPRPGSEGAGNGERAWPAPTQVLDPRVAYLITDILSDTEARIPSFGQGNVLELDRPAAAKTGTTTDWRDNWTVGYTPSLVTGVWAGNADNAPMVDISGIAGAGPIWHDFMAGVLRSTPSEDFARPDGMLSVEVCADSGLLPLPMERTGQGGAVPCATRRPEWFIAGTEPKQADYMHRQVAIDVRTGAPATLDTPPEALHVETFWLLPDEYQDWARANNIPQPTGSGIVAARQPVAPAPGAGAPGQDGGRPGPADGVSGVDVEAGLAAGGTANPAAGLVSRGASVTRAGAPLALISPEPNQIYRIDRTLPAGAQQVPIVARPGPALAATEPTVDLLVDGQKLETVSGPDYTAWWQLAPGRHTFEALARDASGAEVRSQPVVITVQP